MPSQAADKQELARSLANEIRSAGPSSGLVLSLADDLDDIVGGLEFALQYAEGAALSAIAIEIPGLDDALARLADDSRALSEALEGS